MTWRDPHADEPPKMQGPKDPMPGAPVDRHDTHLGRQFDAVLGRKTTGLPGAYHMSSHWDDVDSVDERQPMRRNHGLREGGAGLDSRWGAKQADYTEGIRHIDALDIVKPLAQKYGAGWMHAIGKNPN